MSKLQFLMVNAVDGKWLQKEYSYAVTDVKLSENMGTLSNQDARYSSFGSPISIEENNKMIRFVYNENNDRVRMEVLHDGTAVSTKYYLGDCYELEQKGSDVTERLYLGGDYYSAPMAYVKNGSTAQLCNILRDNLGSITHVTDYKGNVLQELSYDAWGRLRNPADLKVYALGEEPTLYLGRGYTGHEHLAELGLINMNARLYDPMVGRFLSPDPYVQTPEQSQNFNRYSYCMNNPLKYTDKDGKFFLFTAFNAIKDFLVNTFGKVWTQGINAWTNGSNWHSTAMAFKIDMGQFQGSFGQILSRFTWEAPQSTIGYLGGSFANTFNAVKSVSYWGGATAIEYYQRNWGAFTSGSFINGSRGLYADPNNALFQHEYGHYLQSQSMGWAYLPRVGVPSLISAMQKDHNHQYQMMEQDANRRAFLYFNKNVDGFYKSEKDKDANRGWNFEKNPLDVYHVGASGTYFDYKNDDHLKLINDNLSFHAKWFDGIGWFDGYGGFSAALVGIINGIYYKNHRIKK